MRKFYISIQFIRLTNFSKCMDKIHIIFTFDAAESHWCWHYCWNARNPATHTHTWRKSHARWAESANVRHAPQQHHTVHMYENIHSWKSIQSTQKYSIRIEYSWNIANPRSTHSHMHFTVFSSLINCPLFVSQYAPRLCPLLDHVMWATQHTQPGRSHVTCSVGINWTNTVARIDR